MRPWLWSWRDGALTVGLASLVSACRRLPFPIPPAAVRAGLGLRRRVLDLADLLLPVEGALWDLMAGMQRTKLAGALVTTVLADALDAGAREPRELARELGLDLDVTSRVLRYATRGCTCWWRAWQGRTWK